MVSRESVLTRAAKAKTAETPWGQDNLLVGIDGSHDQVLAVNVQSDKTCWRGWCCHRFLRSEFRPCAELTLWVDEARLLGL